jgi:2'-5' RNA ligase
VRLFIGAMPDEPIRRRLGAGIQSLREELGALHSAFRWTPQSNLHVTLHFLGEVDPSRLERLKAALARPLDVPAFDVETGALGRFPPRGTLSVLWIAINRGAEALLGVHDQLADRLSATGFSLERRPFSPHLTLARVRDRDRAHVRALAWPPQTSIDPVVWSVREATLFTSDRSGAAPRYEPLIGVTLAANPRIRESENPRIRE